MIGGSTFICARWSPTSLRRRKATTNIPQSIGEPLFELPLSGWYWQVTRLDAAKPELHASRSLWDSNLPRLADNAVDSAVGGYRKGYAQGPEDVRLRLVERNIDLGDDGRYLIQVAGDASEIDEEMRSFDRIIGAIFAALTLALLLTTALAGSLRAVAAQAHFGKPGGDPLRPRRAAGG